LIPLGVICFKLSPSDFSRWYHSPGSFLEWIPVALIARWWLVFVNLPWAWPILSILQDPSKGWHRCQGSKNECNRSNSHPHPSVPYLDLISSHLNSHFIKSVVLCTLLDFRSAFGCLIFGPISPSEKPQECHLTPPVPEEFSEKNTSKLCNFRYKIPNTSKTTDILLWSAGDPWIKPYPTERAPI
jgi:hypothetical protein